MNTEYAPSRSQSHNVQITSPTTPTPTQQLYPKVETKIRKSDDTYLMNRLETIWNS